MTKDLVREALRPALLALGDDGRELVGRHHGERVLGLRPGVGDAVSQGLGVLETPQEAISSPADAPELLETGLGSLAQLHELLEAPGVQVAGRVHPSPGLGHLHVPVDRVHHVGRIRLALAVEGRHGDERGKIELLGERERPDVECVPVGRVHGDERAKHIRARHSVGAALEHVRCVSVKDDAVGVA
ncbi:hypothetical protein FV222_01575 [Methylobacterium sp. WL103]|uniref:hypothetical protein n=1 Tax=Methylobacterium sp. WL103 TaxID=2603891 RepID=UPI0011D6E32F|nr:hypothetical protein [Methylobacterium sp. WL103]TXN07951.1 hypothetical protein FV222_01575 [Methylobacterium sp. WL103]